MSEKDTSIADAVKVGDTVYYYTSGNTADAPLAGLVLEKFGDMLTICVRSGGNWHDKPRVHHKDSDVIKNNPGLALKLGMWDFRESPAVRATLVELAGEEKPEKDQSKKANAAKV